MKDEVQSLVGELQALLDTKQMLDAGQWREEDYFCANLRVIVFRILRQKAKLFALKSLNV